MHNATPNKNLILKAVMEYFDRADRAKREISNNEVEYFTAVCSTDCLGDPSEPISETSKPVPLGASIPMLPPAPPLSRRAIAAAKKTANPVPKKKTPTFR